MPDIQATGQQELDMKESDLVSQSPYAILICCGGIQTSQQLSDSSGIAKALTSYTKTNICQSKQNTVLKLTWDAF